MPNILPVSDLRNYNEVLKNCQVGEPVFLTKNGRGKFVVMDIEDYEREKAEKKLLMKLQEAEEAVKDESAWMSLDELKKSVGVQPMMKLRINPIVAEDLKNIKEYIAEDNEEMAVKTIQESFAMIAVAILPTVPSTEAFCLGLRTPAGIIAVIQCSPIASQSEVRIISPSFG